MTLTSEPILKVSRRGEGMPSCDMRWRVRKVMTLERQPGVSDTSKSVVVDVTPLTWMGAKG